MARTTKPRGGVRGPARDGGRRNTIRKLEKREMADWTGMQDAVPYAWTGGAGLLGRLMFHAREVQQGRRKPLSWALVIDMPIALGMGWLAYGVAKWFTLGLEPTISAAIAASYLGPYTVDRLLSRLSDKYLGKQDAPA